MCFICLSRLDYKLWEDWDLLLHCILLPSTGFGTWTFDGYTNRWMKKWDMHRGQKGPFFIDNIFPYFRTDRLPLKLFQLRVVVEMPDKFGSWSALSHSKELEGADRSIMKLSLILKSMQTIMWKQVWHLPSCTRKDLRKWAEINRQANGGSWTFNKNPREESGRIVMTLKQIYLPRGWVDEIVNIKKTVWLKIRPL